MSIIQGDGFIVTIIKSKRRKTTALKIKDGKVSIHIPHHLADSIAQEFVLEKTAWIQQKLQLQYQQQPIEKQFINGEGFLFLGKSYPLQLIDQNRPASVRKNTQSLDLYGRQKRLSKKALRTVLINWYKQQATNYLTSRTAHIAQQLNISPRSITVKTYKARWGSCSKCADINYNWKLILAPVNIIDYVIIHELCHIQHFNHSSTFWSLVACFCPTFKQDRLWLKQHSFNLNL